MAPNRKSRKICAGAVFDSKCSKCASVAFDDSALSVRLNSFGLSVSAIIVILSVALNSQLPSCKRGCAYSINSTVAFYMALLYCLREMQLSIVCAASFSGYCCGTCGMLSLAGVG